MSSPHRTLSSHAVSWLGAAALGLVTLRGRAGPGAGRPPRRPMRSSSQVSTDVLASVKADKSIKEGDLQQSDRARRHQGPALRRLPAHDRRGGRPLLAPGDAGDQQKRPARTSSSCCSSAHIPARSGAGARTRRSTSSRCVAIRRTDKEVVVRSLEVKRQAATRSSSTTGSSRPTGGWKIYDVNVLGVWLVENYRNSFAEEIGSNGIDGLINQARRAQQVGQGEELSAARCCCCRRYAHRSPTPTDTQPPARRQSHAPWKPIRGRSAVVVVDATHLRQIRFVGARGAARMPACSPLRFGRAFERARGACDAWSRWPHLYGVDSILMPEAGPFDVPVPPTVPALPGVDPPPVAVA